MYHSHQYRQHAGPPLRLEEKARKSYRPKMSCHQCRFRKVKCDRVKPCGSCCSRGKPDECFFTGEANNRAIDQSQEIKQLRRINKDQERQIHQLLEQLGHEKGAFPESGRFKVEASPVLPSLEIGSRQSLKAGSRTARSKRYKGDDPRDNIYFGNLSLAELVVAYDQLQARPRRNLSHPVPRGVDIYAYQDAAPDPFPCLWKSTDKTDALLNVLPKEHDEIFSYLHAFDKRAQLCCFPHVPDEMTGQEVEKFLSKVQVNAERNPSMLALLFAMMAQGLLFGCFDEHGGQWNQGAVEEGTRLGNVFLAASMHALRLSSFLNRPTLLSLETLLLIGPYLINTGRFLDASTLFGLVIRVAQGMGLHRQPDLLEPQPPPQERTTRQTLWWWILHLDQYYSMSLGRPLGISGLGDCPPPTALSSSTTHKRFSSYLYSFTLLARQILATDDLTNIRIDEYSDRLLTVQANLPSSLQFSASWLDCDQDTLPDWPLDAHAAISFCRLHVYLILLNRQRQENTDRPANDVGLVPGLPRCNIPTSSSSTDPTSRAHKSTSSSQPPIRGLTRVLSSCRSILLAFSFIHTRLPFALIDWSLGQQAFNACMLLAMSWSTTRNKSDIEVVTRAYRIFVDMAEHGAGGGLAGVAATELGAILRGCVKPGFPLQSGGKDGTEGKDGAKEGVMGNTGMMLLEDPGLQGYIPAGYNPLPWTMEDMVEEQPQPQPQPQKQYHYQHQNVSADKPNPPRQQQNKRQRRQPPSHRSSISLPQINPTQQESQSLKLERQSSSNVATSSSGFFSHHASCSTTLSSPTSTMEMMGPCSSYTSRVGGIGGGMSNTPSRAQLSFASVEGSSPSSPIQRQQNQRLYSGVFGPLPPPAIQEEGRVMGSWEDGGATIDLSAQQASMLMSNNDMGICGPDAFVSTSLSGMIPTINTTTAAAAAATSCTW